MIEYKKGLRPNLISYSRIESYVTLYDVVLEFDVILESNDLVFENQYSSKQELLYKLIKLSLMMKYGSLNSL